MQLWLLMNASETLGAGLIGKLAVITRQAERIHLVQPEKHSSPWPRLRGERGGPEPGPLSLSGENFHLHLQYLEEEKSTYS